MHSDFSLNNNEPHLCSLTLIEFDFTLSRVPDYSNMEYFVHLDLLCSSIIIIVVLVSLHGD